jgi:hypothetical protein
VSEAQGDVEGPQLQSLEAYAFPVNALVHLQAITTLTSLKMVGLNQGFDMAGPALEGLTSLRCLAVETQTDGLLSNTSSLTNLTSLSIKQLMPYEGVPPATAAAGAHHDPVPER